MTWAPPTPEREARLRRSLEAIYEAARDIPVTARERAQRHGCTCRTLGSGGTCAACELAALHSEVRAINYELYGEDDDAEEEG